MKYLYMPKGGDIGFPNTVILSDPALLPSLTVCVPLCLYSLFNLIWRHNHILYIILQVRMYAVRRGNH